MNVTESAVEDAHMGLVATAAGIPKVLGQEAIESVGILNVFRGRRVILCAPNIDGRVGGMI